MKLTVRETKKAIKNNQTVKFTLERNNARELTSNKKYYKRYVKAIVKTVKSFYPALDSSYILSELEHKFNNIQNEAADVDKDGNSDEIDALRILRYTIGLNEIKY